MGTSPRAVTRTTQQVVANNQQVAAPTVSAGAIGVTQAASVRNVGAVGGGIVGGGIVGGGIVGGGLYGGSTIVGGGSTVIGAGNIIGGGIVGGSVGVPVSNSVVVGQRFP